MAPLIGDLSSGVRSRNFSQLTGFKMFSYEYSYTGPYFKDIVTNCSIYLRVESDTLDSYKRFKPSIFIDGPTDGTFELFSLVSTFFTLEDLQRSVFVNFDDRDEDFRSVFEDSDLVCHLLKVLQDSDFNLVGFYADYTHEYVNNRVDMFDFHLVLG